LARVASNPWDLLRSPLIELLRARIALDAGAAAVVAQRASPHAREALEILARSLSGMSDEEAFVAEADFHRQIAAATANRVLQEISGRLWTGWKRVLSNQPPGVEAWCCSERQFYHMAGSAIKEGKALDAYKCLVERTQGLLYRIPMFADAMI
jgi:DNA-binding FadR family transcriptional regulator